MIGIGHYYWDDHYLCKKCCDQTIRRCVREEEISYILYRCHSSDYVGHYRGHKIEMKYFNLVYWPSLFKDAISFVMQWGRCPRGGNISRRQEMSLQVILEVEHFDVWVIDFVGPFVSSNHSQYVLVAVICIEVGPSSSLPHLQS